MQPMAPVDELAQVRARIAHLRARERALRDALIAAPEAQRTGRWTRAELVERHVRLFDHRLLPQNVQDDPMFWRDRVLIEVATHPLDGVLAGLSRAAAVGGVPALRLQ